MYQLVSQKKNTGCDSMKKNQYRKISVRYLAILILILAAAGLLSYINLADTLAGEAENQINSIVEQGMSKGHIPGLMLVIVEENEIVMKQGFGFSDLSRGKEVTSNTLFEIGSLTKSFTGLAIIKLKQEGQISLDQPITEYLPWMDFFYKDENGERVSANITVGDLLFHTSGIPSNTIARIPIDNSGNALHHTLTNINNTQLTHLPGTKFHYATVNYDILAAVIEAVTGIKYEEYMYENVFYPLGFKSAGFINRMNGNDNLAQGYKYELMSTRVYNAPPYYGNLAAGYGVLSGEDLQQWMAIQLGTYYILPEYRSIIKESHIANLQVAPLSDGSYYGAGWHVYPLDAGKLIHGGSNPNYYSYVILLPEKNIGIGILANRNSEYVKWIGDSILATISGHEMPGEGHDLFITSDRILTLITIAAIICTICLIIRLVFLWLLMRKKQQKKVGILRGFIKTFLLELSIFVMIALGLLLCPQTFLNGLNWSFLFVWGPISIKTASVSLAVCVILYCIYFSIKSNYLPDYKTSTVHISILSIISGLGNTAVILVVNNALKSSAAGRIKLVPYFILSLGIYIIGQIAVKGILSTMTNQIVADQRKKIISSLLKSTLESFERVRPEHIQTVLTDDIEKINEIGKIMVQVITNVVMVLAALCYLGYVNLMGMLLSLFTILVATYIYHKTGQKSKKIWGEARDEKNRLMEMTNDLLYGYKDLKLNTLRKNAFQENIYGKCECCNEKRLKGDLAFVQTFILGELLFILVIGVVVFLFPVLGNHLEQMDIQVFVLVFLYLIGPVNGILTAIPKIIDFQICLKRINDIDNILVDESTENPILPDRFESLTLENIRYSYKDNFDSGFQLGPISYTFQRGEIIFITGGNGSGKSTLLKILLGLYKGDSGEYYLNGKLIKENNIRHLCSCVFSDYYLFDSIYGYQHNEKELNEKIKYFGLEDKVFVNDNQLSGKELSTGQKKRLALILLMLEKRPIIMLDEWAADQDPEFREYFYHVILKELKKQQRCVIAITHDDKYFGIADKIIKLDIGKFEMAGMDKCAEYAES